MKRGFFFNCFPPPKYLLRPVLGIDVSDRSVKFASLSLARGRFSLAKFGEREIPPGVIEAGEIKNKEALREVLAEIRKETDYPWVAASLPEEQVFVTSLELPAMRRADLRSSVELQLEEYIPLPPSEVIFDYEIVREPDAGGGNFVLAVSAVPRRIVLPYFETLESAGFQVLAMELEAQAIMRSLFRAGDERTFVVIDFGKTRTSFFVICRRAVLFSVTRVTIGGAGVSKSIEKTLGVSYAEAEKLKTQQGLLRSKKDSRLLFALLPIVSALKDELKQLCAYWQGHQKEIISRVIITGGQATLPGLAEYLEAGLNIPVEVGSVWTNIFDANREVPDVNFKQSQRYATSLGLALRGYLDD